MKRHVAGGAILALTLSLVGAHAAFADEQDTTITAEIEGGDLSIAAPTSLSLTTAAPGAVASGTLENVVVTDSRASTLGWVASVSATDFTAPELPDAVLPATGFAYVPSVAVTSGTVSVAATTATGNGPSPIQEATGVAGNHTATWAADISLAIPGDALAGQYTTVLTHSVI